MSEKDGVDNAAFVESTVEESGREKDAEDDGKEKAADVKDIKTDDMTVAKSASAKFTAEEEKMLDMLREIVRKTTQADPDKRPTAKELLDMLDSVPE